jgi:hypothetical protein
VSHSTSSPSRPRRVLAAGLLLAVLATAIAGFVLTVMNRSVPVELYWGARWTSGLWAVVFAGVGAIIAARVVGNAIGWLFLAGGVLSASMFLASEVAIAVAEGGGIPHPALLWYTTWSWIPTTALVVTAIVIFPTGRPRSRFWHASIWAIGTFALAHTVLTATSDVIQPFAAAAMPNPYALEMFGIQGGPESVVYSLYQAALGFGIIALITRRRGADEVTRQQLRWVTFAGAILFACMLIVEVPNGFGLASQHYHAGTVAIAVLVPAVPAAIGVAVLRYRLYEIDRVISRTLSYGLVMAVLAAVYVGTVLVAQGLFAGGTGQRSPTIVAGSTLLVAALFQPLRRRVQFLVDHRFNRRAHDGTGVVMSFAEQLRDEIEVGALISELRVTVSTTVQPQFVSVWRAPVTPGAGSDHDG